MQSIDRRNFLTGSMLAGLAVATSGIVATTAYADSTDETSDSVELEPSETKSCDVVVVGSGPAGLSAAIEAVDLGMSTILLESQAVAGGNTNGTEGLMGVGSPQTIAQGVDVNVMDLLNSELDMFRYQVDALLWKDMAIASGDNIKWLMDHGVQFEDKACDYTNNPDNPQIYHRWKEGTTPAEPLIDSFTSSPNAVLLLETAGSKLIMDGDKVAGIFAIKNDGSVIRIDCKAVILAGGGYVDNVDMISSIIGHEDYYTRSMPGHDGSTIMMAVEVGAKDLTSDRALMGYPTCRHLDTNRGWYDIVPLMNNPVQVWVNQDAERFTNEANSLVTPGLQLVSKLTQKQSFCLYDSEMLKQDFRAPVDFVGVLEAGLADNSPCLWKADTIEELATKAGLDPQKLSETVQTYNEYCAAGYDDDFRKPAEQLMPLENPPFYGWEHGVYVTTTIGGLDYNRAMEVLDNKCEPIPGLYVAGVDGSKIYKNFYTINISGSCNANNIHSGRTAAQSAQAYMA